MIELVDHEHAAGALNDFHGKRMEVNARHAGRKTSHSVDRGGIDWIIRVRNAVRSKGGLVKLHFLLGPGCHGWFLSRKRAKEIPRSGRRTHAPDASKVR